MLFELLAPIAQAQSTVIIFGESGTGKEYIARRIHSLSPRHAGPFVAYNCADASENLIEATLFGHTQGAFTGAEESREGVFMRAHGGTLYLDEIGDAPLAIQAKLLRAIQQREIQPLGMNTGIPVDFRLIVSTARNLRQLMREGRFREDLYYRIHVVPVQLDPLRVDPSRVPVLAAKVEAQLAHELGQEPRGFTLDAIEALLTHGWPGNIRELRNRIEAALVLSRDRGLQPWSADELFPKSEVANIPTYSEAKLAFEKQYIERLLHSARGNVTEASRLSSKSRTELYALMRRHGLDRAGFKEK